MGGQLEVISQPGLGSRFFFSLKLRSEAVVDQAKPAPLVGDPNLPAMSILLVEDNSVNQIVAATLLESNGHSVQVAEDGQQAVEALTTTTFDLILMDVQMPVMDGLMATSAIRQLEAGQGRRTPIVALTAQALKSDRERCVSAGMDGHVAKPIVPGELWAAMRAAVDLDNVRGPLSPARTQSVPTAGPLARAGRLCDLEALLARVGGNREAWRKIIGQFQTAAPAQLREIEVAIGADEPNQLPACALSRPASFSSTLSGIAFEAVLRVAIARLASGPPGFTLLQSEGDHLTYSDWSAQSQRVFNL